MLENFFGRFCKMKSLFRKFSIVLSGALCLGAAAVGLAACGDEDSLNVQSGTSTTLITSKAPEDLSAENAVYAFLQKQSELKSYKITTTGKAVANLARYEQEINNITFKNGDDYLNQAQSESWLVKMKHQAFSKAGKVVYRDNFDGGLSVTTKENYKAIYGVTADDITLGGYIINEKTLRYATLENVEGDVLVYYLRLAGDRSYAGGASTESATAGIRLQARAYGSLDNLPVFSDVEIRLRFKKDWTPVGYTSSCSYDCKKIFEMTITQTLDCTYSDVNLPVEIPSVSEFNRVLGSEPSVVLPGAGDTSVLSQLTAAFGAALGDGEDLTLPLSVTPDLFGAPITFGGNLSLKLKSTAMEQGELLDAVTFRYDMALGSIPILSNYANTFTVRYLGGEIFLTLHNVTDGKDDQLFTYIIDLHEWLSVDGSDLTVEDPQEFMDRLVDLEKTQNGYRISLKKKFVDLLDSAYGEFLSGLEEKFSDTHQYLRSFFGTSFTSLTLDLNGSDKINALSVSIKGTPGENLTMGEKIDVSIDTKLLGGMIQTPFEGELQLRFEPSAFWRGDLLGIVKAHLFLDLTPASMLLSLIGSLGIEDIPAFVKEIKSVDAYYTGDGILTVAINGENRLPVHVMKVDLAQSLPQTPPDADQGMTKLPQFRLETNENGILFALGEPAVSAIGEAYSSLVNYLIAMAKENAGNMGSMAESILRSWLDAEITEVEFLFGRTEEGNKPMFDLAVKGIPYQKTDIVRLFGVGLTYNTQLTEEEREAVVSGNAVKALDEWDARNALYGRATTVSGITIPAIKGNLLLENVIGAVEFKTYAGARNAHGQSTIGSPQKNSAGESSLL